MRKQLFNITTLFVAFLVFSGCRTYGGYGTEQASFDMIKAINIRFAQDLEQAKGELPGFKQAAGSNMDLKPALLQYESLLAMHEEMIREHDKITSDLSVKTGLMGRLSTSYRDLNRALGYITAEQLGMENKYNDFAASLLKDDMQAAVQEELSRYAIAPAFYERIRFALAQKSVSESLQIRASS